MSESPSQENRQFRLDRIVEVLELASATHEGILLMDVVAGLGIPSSTAYRLLGEMRRVGILEADNGRGRHRLTKRFAELGTTAQMNRETFAMVEKAFSKLSDEFGETVYLVKMRGRVISLVGFVRPLETTGLHPGNAFPIHASAAGKILWAHQPKDVLAAELARPHVKFREKTHVNEDEIRMDLQKALEEGYGVHDEEWDEGIFTMAVPLFLGRKVPSMALGVIGVKDRLLKKFTREEVLGKLTMLRNTVDPILADR